MPTGYTSKIYDGEQSFKDFATQCARGIGYMIHMRDDDWDAPLAAPTVRSYHLDALKTLSREFTEVLAMTDEEAERAASKAHAEALFRHDAIQDERISRLRRCEAMLEDVNAWQLPNDEFKGLKDLMVDQLQQEIDMSKPMKGYDDPPKRKTGEEYKADRLKSLSYEISFHQKYHAQDVERAKKSAEWLRLFNKSMEEYS